LLILPITHSDVNIEIRQPMFCAAFGYPCWKSARWKCAIMPLRSAPCEELTGARNTAAKHAASVRRALCRDFMPAFHLILRYTDIITLSSPLYKRF